MAGPDDATEPASGMLRHGGFLLDMAAEAAGIGAWEYDITSGEVRWTPALEALYGLEPGTFPGTYEGYLELIHPEDRANSSQSVTRAIEEGGTHRVEHRALLPDGTVRWIEGRGGVVYGEDGAPVAMAGISIDATGRRRAAQRLDAENRILEALNTASRRIGDLEVAPLVQAVTDAATELTDAAFGAFFYNSTDRHGHPYQLYTLSGAPPEAFAGFGHPRSTAIFRPTFEGDYVVRYDDVTASPHYGQSAPHHGLPRGHLPVRSYLAAPVSTRGGEVLGGIILGHPEPSRFDADDERLLTGLADQAAVLIENQRLQATLQRELAVSTRIAHTLQRSLRPPPLPHIEGIEVAAVYQPLSGEVGGDFYDLYSLAAGDWMLVVGDVCGKGAEAAAVTSLARWSTRTAGVAGQEPDEVLHTLDAQLATDYARDPGRFVTVLCARLQVGRPGGEASIRIALGGHPPAIMRRADGTVENVGVPGTLLGAVERVKLHTVEVPWHPGDTLIGFTDGATELRRNGVELGRAGLLAMVAEIDGTAADIVDHLSARLTEYGEGAARDDLAIIALRRSPDARPTPDRRMTDA